MKLFAAVLAPAHRAILTAVGQSEIGRQVYFTGGTMLAAGYLRHRRSFDLDFFSQELPDDLFVADAIQKIANQVSSRKVRFVRYPNRWQYFFVLNGGAEVKLEIVYFPFLSLGRRVLLEQYKLLGDSLRDIAVNKTHAIYEREAPRDTYDLYVILCRHKATLSGLLRDVEKKFGVAIDPVHLIARLADSAKRLDEVRPLYLGRRPRPKEVRLFFEHLGYKILRRLL